MPPLRVNRQLLPRGCGRRHEPVARRRHRSGTQWRAHSLAQAAACCARSGSPAQHLSGAASGGACCGGRSGIPHRRPLRGRPARCRARRAGRSPCIGTSPGRARQRCRPRTRRALGPPARQQRQRLRVCEEQAALLADCARQESGEDAGRTPCGEPPGCVPVTTRPLPAAASTCPGSAGSSAGTCAAPAGVTSLRSKNPAGPGLRAVAGLVASVNPHGALAAAGVGVSAADGVMLAGLTWGCD